MFFNPAESNAQVPLTEAGRKLKANYTGMFKPLRTELTAKLPDANFKVAFTKAAGWVL